MMSLQPEVHYIQHEILQQLLFSDELGFAQMHKPTNIESNQFTFHLKRLVADGLVAKTASGKYTLTSAGKEYANQHDTESRQLEKQPKSSVILVVERQNNGKTEYLQQQRLKQPWYGYWVYVTGKIRWGESIYQAAARELYEETGLQGSFTLKAVSHERDIVQGQTKVLEDKLFYVFHCTDAAGDLLQPKEAKNQWMTKDEFLSQKNIDGAARFFDYIAQDSLLFEENDYFFEEEDF